MHPRMAEARRVYIDAHMRLDLNPAITKYWAHGARLGVNLLIVALHGAQRDNDRDSWVTLSKLFSEAKTRQLGSANFVQAFVASLVDRNLLVSKTASRDRRVQILLPTAKFMKPAIDISVVRASVATILDDRPVFDLALARDHEFIMELFAGWLRRPYDLEQRRRLHPQMMNIILRANGFFVLLAVLQSALASAGGSTATIGYQGVADAQKVSRAHVRSVVADLAAEGLVTVVRKGGQEVEISPELWAIFDAYVADASHQFADWCADAHAVVMAKRSG